ncbi:MAG: TatD family hydrolase [Candidatus Cloacimonetes bacterium]|nr:TatD family hydrolase [Candidatus Cloacimonadota bacterium]
MAQADNKPTLHSLLDSHVHLAEPRLRDNLATELSLAREVGVNAFLSCALNRAEYDWHRDADIDGMRWVAGIHPHWEHSSPDDLPHLESLCESGLVAGIGEVGLDRRGDIEAQRPLLDRQLGLALDFDLPVVLHCVRAWPELLGLLKRRFPKVHGMLHGFNAPVATLEPFFALDLAISLGGGVTSRPDASQVVRRVLRHGRVLLETDAPWQLPRWLDDDYNRPAHLALIAQKVATLGGVSYEQLCAMQHATARELGFA